MLLRGGDYLTTLKPEDTPRAYLVYGAAEGRGRHHGLSFPDQETMVAMGGSPDALLLPATLSARPAPASLRPMAGAHQRPAREQQRCSFSRTGGALGRRR